MEKKKIKHDYITGLEKARKYCAYQERSQFEVRNKLYELGLYPKEVEQGIAQLIEENFVNEERFAKIYSRSKFNQLKWGKNKIKEGLKHHRISDFCIKSGLKEINSSAYTKTVQLLYKKRIDDKKTKVSKAEHQKAIKYILSKGFEYEVILDALKIE